MSCLKTKHTSGILNMMLAMFAVFILLFSTLPAYAERLPDFLSRVQPSEIFPGADRYGSDSVMDSLRASASRWTVVSSVLAKTRYCIREKIRLMDDA